MDNTDVVEIAGFLRAEKAETVNSFRKKMTSCLERKRQLWDHILKEEQELIPEKETEPIISVIGQTDRLLRQLKSKLYFDRINQFDPDDEEASWSDLVSNYFMFVRMFTVYFY